MFRKALLTALISWVVVPALALAGDLQPFNGKLFDQLQTEGKPVVVVVHATWCPTCKAQLPIQTSLMRSAEFQGYTMFTVDFDADQALLKRFSVIKQSTMIVFKGKTEVGRSIGDTSRDGIESLMLKAKG
jgi:thiol-disulfide isomerase/thioredoxin